MNPERETVERRIAEVKRSLATRLDLLGGRVNRARRVLAVRRHVRENLGVSLGAAAAVGFLLGRRAVHNRPLLAGDLARYQVPRRSITASIIESLLRSLVTTLAATAASALVAQQAGQEAAEAELFNRGESRDDRRPFA